jgi:hypothetical protein
VLEGFYDRLKSAIEVRGATLYPFQLTCTVDENVRRIQQPDRERFLKMTSAEFLRSSLARSAYDPPAEVTNNVIIDTTSLPAIETARLIVARLS